MIITILKEFRKMSLSSNAEVFDVSESTDIEEE